MLGEGVVSYGQGQDKKVLLLLLLLLLLLQLLPFNPTQQIFGEWREGEGGVIIEQGQGSEAQVKNIIAAALKVKPQTPNPKPQTPNPKP